MVDITRLCPQEPYEIDEYINIEHFDDTVEPQKSLMRNFGTELALRCGLSVKSTTVSLHEGVAESTGNFYVVCDECDTCTTDDTRIAIIKSLTERWRYSSPYVRFHLTRYSFKSGAGFNGSRRVWLHFVLTSQPENFTQAKPIRN
jgi:hypothetical protein